jgi:hypothetical protein
MTYEYPDHELTLSQAMEVYPNGGETPAPSRPSRSLRALSTESPSHQPQQPEKLQFLSLDEWDERNSYDEDELSCLHYSIEWKVLVNNKKISNDTEQDLVLAPMAYWHEILKPKLNRLLRRKVAQNRTIRCDDTSVVASVTDRSQRDLIKRFNDININ